MSHTNFKTVWRDFRCGRKKLSTFFLKVLRARKTYLYDEAIEINKKDRFIMHTDPAKKKVTLA